MEIVSVLKFKECQSKSKLVSYKAHIKMGTHRCPRAYVAPWRGFDAPIIENSLIGWSFDAPGAYISLTWHCEWLRCPHHRGWSNMING